MSDTFREKEVRIGEETIILKRRPIDQIFEFGSQPYIIGGTSGAGKTKLSMHLIYRYARECTKIFYVSSTKAKSFAATDDDINLIPKIFRRTPSYEEIYGIWHDIKEEFTAFASATEDYERILLKLFDDDKDTARNTIKYIKEKCNEVYKDRKRAYKDEGRNEDEIEFCAKRDENAMRCSALSILVADAVKQKGNQSLSEKELLIVNSIGSAKPKILLILDDVTAEMEALKVNGTRMVKYDGRPYKVSQAYNLLITDILTRGRHYNCLIALFLHDLRVVQTEQIKNLIIFDSATSQAYQLLKKVPTSFKRMLQIVTPIVFNGEYKYYFVFGRPNDNDICVGKADLFSGPIEFSPVNKALVKAYEEIARLNKEDNVVSNNTDDSDSDDSSDSDDDSD